MNIITMWEMAKRYIAGAVVGVLASLFAGWGITEALNPGLLEQLNLFVSALLTGIFYVSTILFKTWRQKKVIESGAVLPERVESRATAVEATRNGPTPH